LLTLVPLAQADPPSVEALLDAAFGVDRHRRTAYRLREGTAWIPELSFAMCDGDALVATIQCWPLALLGDDGGAGPLILVGPVAVMPGRQRDGIGRRLMEAMLAAADAGGIQDMLLIGDPEYYERFFGFTAEATGGWAVPGPVERHRLLARLADPTGWPATGTLGPRRPASAG
jgi:predicted N-acetyltransferase YhbS